VISLEDIFLKEDSIIVSGGSGFIGFNFITFILDNSNINVYVYRTKEINSKNSYRIKELKKYKNFKVINSNSLKDIAKPIIAVINFASYGVDSSQKEISNLLDGNIIFALELVNIAKKFNAKFIHTSTCYEYMDTNENIKETMPLMPDSLYGAFKASASIILKEVCKAKKVNYVALRLFGVYGPNESGSKLIPYLYHNLNNNKEIRLTDGIQIRDYTHVIDVAKAYLLVCFNSNDFEIYNVCSSQGVKIRDFILKFVEVNKCDPSLLQFGAKRMTENNFLRVVGDNTRMINEYGWKPEVSLESGLMQVFNSYKEMQSKQP